MLIRFYYQKLLALTLTSGDAKGPQSIQSTSPKVHDIPIDCTLHPRFQTVAKKS